MIREKEKTAAGVNYIRLMKQGYNVYDIAREMEEDVQYVKDCIALARKNKDEADSNIKAVLKPPNIDVKDEYHTGMLQVVKRIEVELVNPIIVKYSDDEVTEFQTLMPVKITINRK